MYKVVTSFDELLLGYTYHFDSNGLHSSVPSGIGENYGISVSNFRNFHTFRGYKNYSEVAVFSLYNNQFYLWKSDGTTLGVFTIGEFDFSFDCDITAVTQPKVSASYDDVYHESFSYDVGLLTSYTNMFTDYLGVGVGVLVGLVSLFCLIKMAFRRG